jgi:hypothetical protein
MARVMLANMSASQATRLPTRRRDGGPAYAPLPPKTPPLVLAGSGFVAVSVAIVAIVAAARPSLFLHASATGLLFAAICVAVSSACIGQWYVHRLLPERDFVRHNEVGGFIIAVAGTLYAVALGFLTVITWQHFSEANDLVTLESAAATDAWHMAVGLPPAIRVKVRQDVLAYSQLMISREWPSMRDGGFDTKADIIVMDAIGAAGGFRPADLGQGNAQSATLQQLGILHDLRQRRLAENAGGIAPFEWLVLLIGAGCLVCFCWLFGVANRKAHLLMTSSVVVIVTSLLILLFELQYPFRTNLRISPDSWLGVVAHIRIMQTGTQSYMRM